MQGRGIRFKKVIWKGCLRLRIQTVLPGGQTRARGAREKNPPALQHYWLLILSCEIDCCMTCASVTHAPATASCSATEEKLRRSKNSTAFDRESNSLSITVEFFWLRFFFGVHFYRQTPGTCLLHTVLLVGVTDPGNSGVFIFESWIYMGLSSFSNAHNFVKNLVWTSFYSPFWSSWADLSFAPTFRVWRQILFSASALCQGHSTTMVQRTKFSACT